LLHCSAAFKVTPAAGKINAHGRAAFPFTDAKENAFHDHSVMLVSDEKLNRR